MEEDKDFWDLFFLHQDASEPSTSARSFAETLTTQRASHEVEDDSFFKIMFSDDYPEGINLSHDFDKQQLLKSFLAACNSGIKRKRGTYDESQPLSKKLKTELEISKSVEEQKKSIKTPKGDQSVRKLTKKKKKTSALKMQKNLTTRLENGKFMYRCSLCSFESEKKLCTWKHIKRHYKKKDIQALRCEENQVSVENKETAVVHEWKECEFCGYSSPRENDMIQHNKFAHEREKSHADPRFPFTFDRQRQKTNLEDQREIPYRDENGTLHHRCAFKGCKFTNTNKSVVTRHYDSAHTNNDPRMIIIEGPSTMFKCKNCSFKNERRNVVANHFDKEHTNKSNEKDSRFISYRDEKGHLRYKCTFKDCGYGDAPRANVIRHYEKHHASNKPKVMDEADPRTIPYRGEDGKLHHKCSFEGCDFDKPHKSDVTRHYDNRHVPKIKTSVKSGVCQCEATDHCAALFKNDIVIDEGVVQCGLKGLVTCDTVLDVIRKDVNVMTKLMIEVSRVVQHCVMNSDDASYVEYLHNSSDEPRFEFIFLMLSDRSTSRMPESCEAIFMAYMNSRDDTIKHDIAFRNKLVEMAALDFRDCFKSTVVVNYPRILELYKKAENDLANTENLAPLSTIVENESKFSIDYWWKFIKPMLKMKQNLNRTPYGCNYRVVPIYNNAWKHVSYGCSSVIKLHRLVYPDVDASALEKANNENKILQIFLNLFDLEKYFSPKNIVKFNGLITTNGVSASIHYNKAYDVPPCDMVGQDCRGKRLKHSQADKPLIEEKNSFDRFGGFDPGDNKVLSGVVWTPKEQEVKKNVFSNRRYLHDTCISRVYKGTGKSNKKRAQCKFTYRIKKKQFIKKMIDDVAYDYVAPQIKSKKIRNRSFKKRMTLKQEKEKNKIEERQEAEAEKRQEMPKTDNVKVQERRKKAEKKKRNVFLSLGDAGDTHMIGYHAPPLKAILAAFEQESRINDNVTLVSANEFRSTVTCSKCFDFALVAPFPLRHVYCPRCKLTQDRDVNGGKNILIKGMKQQGVVSYTRRMQIIFDENFKKPKEAYLAQREYKQKLKETAAGRRIKRKYRCRAREFKKRDEKSPTSKDSHA